MTDDQYRELVEFLGVKFDRIDGRFEGLETRFEGLETRFEGLETRFEGLDTRFKGLETRTAGVEIGQESLGDQIRQVAEGVSANGERIDRLETTMNRRFDRLEEDWWVRFDDHERRIRKLEG